MTGMGFWIDGLCINQDDVLEKKHQVNLRMRVYSQAMSTVAWLGAPTGSSATSINILRNVFGQCSVSYIDGSKDH
ncbi:uncharacterized protein M421DRAFT_421834 [Didymella exigua CBS 183.55]|uniref:Heterokaryon incompatibility domain-containing protein n=1 Tax=Didymella exigua CBS 183.55 TaxID=1150837 RepID=A0A6A5RGI7_9PLEO|nr:uncharacterized protein M421DRAFT_421834 [Didymella exigua CBS 183.55]KAF1927425.1 hypothetical protein M421DRAFT_421834 [Didymella exigua CBS 183.55]